MQKIGNITSTADANGEWTNGNVAAGIAPTIMDAAWFNTIQRELINIVTSGGLTLDPANDAQVLAALKKIFLQSGNYLSEIAAAGTAAQIAALKNLGSSDGTLKGRLLNIQIFTASGIYTPSSGTAKIKVKQTGGGGAGGGTLSTSSAQIASGGGGNGGTYGDTGLMAVPSSPVSIIIGTAGTGVAGGNGGSGGSTSFGAYLVSPGGAGGPVGAAGGAGTLASDNISSLVSTGTNVSISLPGNKGTGAFNISVASNGIKSGGGGDSQFGIGGGGINGTTSPNIGRGYGSGGGGNAAGPGAASSIAGANGASGICIIEEYA